MIFDHTNDRNDIKSGKIFDTCLLYISRLEQEWLSPVAPYTNLVGVRLFASWAKFVLAVSRGAQNLNKKNHSDIQKGSTRKGQSSAANKKFQIMYTLARCEMAHD